MNHFIFTNQALKTFSRLKFDPENVLNNIMKNQFLDAFKALKNLKNPLSIFKKLSDLEPATHFFEVGIYAYILQYIPNAKKNEFRFRILDIQKTSKEELFKQGVIKSLPRFPTGIFIKK